MEGRLREVIANQLIMNSPQPLILSLYVFDETYVKHSSMSDIRYLISDF